MSLPCAPKACAACPWRKSNQGKPHPHGWYDPSNLDRLWRGLRTGEAPGMTCHPTDTNNLVPEGHRAPSDSAVRHECAAADALMAIFPSMEFLPRRQCVANERQESMRMPEGMRAEFGLVRLGFVRETVGVDPVATHYGWMERHGVLDEVLRDD